MFHAQANNRVQFRLYIDKTSDLGDWGKQYGLLALAYERYGDEAELKRDPIDHLFKLYVKINAEKEAETEEIKQEKAKGQDVTKLEATCLDEQARGYFKRMVSAQSGLQSHITAVLNANF